MRDSRLMRTNAPEHLGARERRVQEEPDLNVADIVVPVRPVNPGRRRRVGFARGGRTERQPFKHGVDVLLTVLAHRRRVPSEEVAEVDRYEAEVVVFARRVRRGKVSAQ